MIIKLYDNENYEYPLINIDDNHYEEFKSILKEYQAQGDYNIDDFLHILESKEWFKGTIDYDKELFF